MTEPTPEPRKFSPVSFGVPSLETPTGINWTAAETTFLPLWTKTGAWFNMPPGLENKSLNLRMVRRTGANVSYFFLLPWLDEGVTDDIKQQDLGVKYDLYSQPVQIFPLLPNADSRNAGLVVGIRTHPHDGPPTKNELRLLEFNNDFAIAVGLASRLNEHISVRVIQTVHPLFPDVKIPRLAGGDFTNEDHYPPTEADAGRIPVNDQKKTFVAGLDQEKFEAFLISTGRLVASLDRKQNAVQRVCNAPVTR